MTRLIKGKNGEEFLEDLVDRTIDRERAALKRLTRDQIAALPPQSVRYVRLYRAYDPTPLLVYEGLLSLKVNTWVVKDEPAAIDLTLDADARWAEYRIWTKPSRYHRTDESDADESGLLMVEDWCMEIYGNDGSGAPYRERDDRSRDDFLRWDQESLDEARSLSLPPGQLHVRARART